MRPLKDSIQSLTTQKDALLAEKTALKNEVLSNVCPILKPLLIEGLGARWVVCEFLAVKPDVLQIISSLVYFTNS